MCWNFQISVAAASQEACFLLLLVIRACCSSEPRFRQQLSLLPILSSILLVEIIESIIWHNQHSLTGIQEADEEGNACPKLNHILTLALWMIIWMQPYSVIFAARNSGDPNNYGALLISQNMSVLFGLAAICMYLYAWYFIEDPDNTLPRMHESQFKSYLNRDTCTYIGLHGHLHWTIAMAETILTPNAFAYAMLFLSTAFARPKQIVAVPSLIMMLIFFLQSIWFEGPSRQVQCGALQRLLYLCTIPYNRGCGLVPMVYQKLGNTTCCLSRDWGEKMNHGKLHRPSYVAALASRSLAI